MHLRENLISSTLILSCLAVRAGVESVADKCKPDVSLILSHRQKRLLNLPEGECVKDSRRADHNEAVLKVHRKHQWCARGLARSTAQAAREES